jgi:hypothetical protein
MRKLSPTGVRNGDGAKKSLAKNGSKILGGLTKAKTFLNQI